jgi:hypothetical protein
MKLTNELRNSVVKELLNMQLTDLLYGDLPVKIHWNSTKLKSKIVFILEMKEHTANPATIRSIAKVYDHKINKLLKVVQKFYDIHC